MRLFISSLVLLAVIFFSPDASAGNAIVTKQYKVEGVCGKCKERIENAAYVKGVKFAEWDKKTHILNIKYDSSKTSPEIFLKSIAKSGHDNEMFEAEDGDYDKISPCCKYKSGIKAH